MIFKNDVSFINELSIIKKLKSTFIGKLSIGMMLFFVMSIAFFVRCHACYVNGGADYMQWLTTHYYAPLIARFYQITADQILSGQYHSLARPFGYPAFLALLKLLGIKQLIYMRITQGLIDSFSIIPLYLILRYLQLNKFIIFLGILLYAIVPFFSFNSTMLFAEWVSIPVILWMQILLIKTFHAKGKMRYLFSMLAGLVIGYGALCRPDLILLIIPAILWMFWIKEQKLMNLIFLLLPILLLIGSWGLFNKIHHDQWVFTSTGRGNTLYEGLGLLNNPYDYHLSDKAMRIYITRMNVKFHSIKSDDFFMHLYLNAWKEHPLYVIKTIIFRWKKMLLQNNFPGSFISMSNLQNFIASYGIYVLILSFLLCFSNLEAFFIIALPVIYALFSVGLVHYEFRYTMYIYLSYLFAILLIINKLMEFFYKNVRLIISHFDEKKA